MQIKRFRTNIAAFKGTGKQRGGSDDGKDSFLLKQVIIYSNRRCFDNSTILASRVFTLIESDIDILMPVLDFTFLISSWEKVPVAQFEILSDNKGNWFWNNSFVKQIINLNKLYEHIINRSAFLARIKDPIRKIYKTSPSRHFQTYQVHPVCWVRSQAGRA